jgi:head-tail adaptor
MNNVITLINKPFPDVSAVKRKVFADVKSVNRYEFYKAQSVGILPSAVFSVFKYDYKNENVIEFNDKIWTVIRAFETKNEQVELTCCTVELGTKNCKIKIFLPVFQKDLDGFSTENLVEIADIYAYKEDKGGTENSGISGTFADLKTVFRFEKNFEISPRNIIFYNSKNYNILNVSEIVGRENFVEVTAVCAI